MLCITTLCVIFFWSIQFFFRKSKLQIYQLPGRQYNSTDLAAQPSSCCRLVSFYPIWIQLSHQAAVGQYIFIQSGYSLAIKLLQVSIFLSNLDITQPSRCYRLVSFYPIWIQPSHQAAVVQYLFIQSGYSLAIKLDWQLATKPQS